MTVRTLPLVAGLATLGAGVFIALGGVGGGGLARGGGFLVAALVAGAIAVGSLLVRSVVDEGSRPLADRTDRPGVRQPGDELDELLAGGGRAGTRGEVRERLTSVGTDVLVRRYGCSRERARSLLETGEWTDDPDARALFAERPGRPSLRDRVQVLLGGQSTFRRRVAAATAELVRIDREAES